jgi:hypothetical protein
MLVLCLVLQLLVGHKPHKVKPKPPDPDRFQWIENCRHIGWANEYPACRLRQS